MWFGRNVHHLSLFTLGVATSLLLTACEASNGGSICGDTRPCVPEGTWLIQYEEGPEGVILSANSVRIDPEGNAELIDETVPDDSCVPGDTRPGELITNAELSADGCDLLASVDKAWCESGEDNCDERTIRLSFCEGGDSDLAVGVVRACICWQTGGPFCDGDDDFFETAASSIPVP